MSTEVDAQLDHHPRAGYRGSQINQGLVTLRLRDGGKAVTKAFESAEELDAFIENLIDHREDVWGTWG